MLAVDLHVHSNHSDGSFSPAQLVDYALEKGLAAFALTDHDTIDGLEEAESYAECLRMGQIADFPASQAQNAHSIGDSRRQGVSRTGGQETALAAERQGTVSESDAPGLRSAQCPSKSYAYTGSVPNQVPEVIPGIEFSTEYQKQDVHIVGLYIDYRNADFCQKLKAFVDSRNARNRKMCRLLTEAGFPVAYDELLSEFPGAVITRAHYAKYMLSRGYVKTMSEAFDRYIGDSCPYYVPREKVTPVDAVKLILSAGGVPILAHPVLYHMSDDVLDALTAQLAQAGLAGLEAVYSTYTAFDERRMRALAKKYGLLVSGGSDFHGANKPGLDLGTGYGSLYVPYSILQDIKKLLPHENPGSKAPCK